MTLIANWLANAPDFAVPYALAALGLILTERSGVLSLGAEGYMLVGALSGIGAQLAFGSVLISLVVAMLATALVSLLFGILVVGMRVNQVIAGLAIVFFCQGLTSFVGNQFDWMNRAVAGLPTLDLGPLTQIPFMGRLLFGQNLMVYLTLALIVAMVAFLDRSMTGLRLRAVGENPVAADAAGVAVSRYRLLAVLAGSSIAGLAGAYLSVISTRLWVEGMIGGRGWIAVGLVIFARWQPWRALSGALLFGGIEALVPQLAAAGIRLPQYFVLMTPYAVTLAVMIWVSLSKQRADTQPAALGEPWVREERR